MSKPSYIAKQEWYDAMMQSKWIVHDRCAVYCDPNDRHANKDGFVFCSFSDLEYKQILYKEPLVCFLELNNVRIIDNPHKPKLKEFQWIL